MRHKFRQRVKCAHDDVKGEPSEHQPASPVVTHEQEDSADDSDYSNDGDQDDPMIERTFRKVIDEAATSPATMNKQPVSVTSRGRFMAMGL